MPASIGTYTVLGYPYTHKPVIDWCRLIHDSYKHWLQKTLAGNDVAGEALAKTFYEAKFVLLSHKFADVPRFVFANKSAQALWGYSWEEFLGMPSSESAEPEAREEREKLLQRVNLYGFIDDYCGIRIAKNGRRFRILEVILWNVLDDHHALVGQAAMFEKFESI